MAWCNFGVRHLAQEQVTFSGELLLTEQLEHLSLPDIKEVAVRNLSSFLRLTIVFTGQRDTFHYWWLFFTL